MNPTGVLYFPFWEIRRCGTRTNMDIKVIRNRSDYDKALKYLSMLMDKNPVRGSEEENILELLMLVIKDYEEKFGEPIIVDPIEAIKFRMDQMQFTRKDLILFFGSISRVSEVLAGKRNLSLSMIRKLHDGLGIPLESLVSQRRICRKIPRRPKKQKRISVPKSRRKKKAFI